jgi:hypothetical protein
VSREVYIERNFRADALAVIERANAVIAEYQAQGFRLTLRQLYYQFVARDLLANTLANYKLLGRTMKHARDAGVSDWDAVVDRTRQVNNNPSWDGPGDFLADAVAHYAEDLWAGQKYRPEVWIEKDALLGVIAGVCEELRVPYFANHGNVSQLPVRDAGLRFAEQIGQGHTPVVLYLGDHDPSGLEMDRDLQKRVNLYAETEIEVRRVALTMAQVRRHRPPPNFAKEKDANFAKYRAQFGTSECWELDALAPTVIAGLIREQILPMVDAKRWRKAEAAERRNRKRLASLAEQAGDFE